MVDIVIPNYNKIEFIEECIKSLRSQTFSNWRCIVVDGHSDDGSWELLQKVADKDDRFDLYQLDRIGLYESWNFGLRKVSNPYFTVLTSDDVWHSEWLEKATSALNKYDNVVAAAARTRYIDQEGRIGPIARRNSRGESILLDEEVSGSSIWDGIECSTAGYFLGTIFNSIHSLIVRSSILDEHLFPTDVGTAADLEWSTRLGLYGDIVYFPNVEVYWRRYEGQASGKSIDERKELGRNIAKMLKRMKPEILQRLSESKRKRFVNASDYYFDEILSYFFNRPPEESFMASPAKAVRHAVQAAFSHPRFFLGEIYNYLIKKETYTLQERARLAKSVIEMAG